MQLDTHFPKVRAFIVVVTVLLFISSCGAEQRPAYWYTFNELAGLIAAQPAVPDGRILSSGADDGNRPTYPLSPDRPQSQVRQDEPASEAFVTHEVGTQLSASEVLAFYEAKLPIYGWQKEVQNIKGADQVQHWRKGQLQFTIQIEPKQQFGPDHPWSTYTTIYRMELRDHWKLDF